MYVVCIVRPRIEVPGLVDGTENLRKIELAVELGKGAFSGWIATANLETTHVGKNIQFQEGALFEASLN